MAPRSSFLIRSAKSFFTLIVARGGGLVLSLVISVLLANRLGAVAGTDAFFLVRRLTTGVTEALRRVVIYAYIPPLVAMMRSSDGAVTGRLWRSHLIRNVALALLAAVLIALAAPWVIATIAPGFDAERSAIGTGLIHIFAFLIPAGLVLASMTSLLFASRRFGLPEFARALPRFLVVILLLFLVPPLGVTALAWVLLGGTVVVVLILIPSLRRVIRDNSATKDQASAGSTPAATGDEAELGVRGRALPIIIWQGYIQGSGWLDLAFASLLVVGGVSVLAYGQRLVQIIPAVLNFSLFTIMYTEFAHRAADGESQGLQRSVVACLRTGLFVLVPFMIFLWVAADQIVELLFHHGAFGDQATALTTSVVRWFSPMVVLMFFTNTLWLGLVADGTSQHLRMSTTVSSAGLLFRAGCLMLLAEPLGVIGIALAAILSSALVCGLAYRFAARQWGGVLRRGDLAVAARIVACALVSGALMYGVRAVAGVEPGAGVTERILVLAVLVTVGALSYLGAAALLGMEEISIARELVRRRTRRASSRGA